ncbi:Choline transport protein [Fusarium oxysporum f. sp. rapae]|uniref:Choline transport protein n=1 Tax=Fusarium oxysporum f. sp. rapae TaxID=485398 RepID=A0A8J5NMC2_FUSOX|nr:Choline transport protein [Fusarium oxysporum f. sp. rapae]
MISTLSWTINAASVALIGSQLLVPFPQFFNGYEPERWHLFLIYQGLNLLSLFYNLFLLKRTNWIHDCAFVLTLSTFFVTCITCLSRSRKQSPEWVWTNFETTTGWNDGVAFMTSLVTPCYMHGGLDAALYLAEETLNASQTVPRALMATIGIGFLTAFTFAVSMAYCISDLEGLLTSTMPIFQLWRTATRSDAAGVTFLVSLTIIVIFVLIAIQQTTSRLIWAFPRDQGLYLSDHFSQLSPKLRDIPSNALILNTVLVFLCGCLFLGSTAAFNALVGSFLLLQMISFALLAALLIYQKRSSTFLPQSRGFRVPDPVGWVCNIGTIVAAVIELVLFVFPGSLPVSALSMNYASVVLLALLLFSVVNWFMFAKQQYQGPWVELILNQTISPNTCFEDAQTVVYISRRSRAGLKLSVFDVIANIPMRLLAAELAANSKVLA